MVTSWRLLAAVLVAAVATLSSASACEGRGGGASAPGGPLGPSASGAPVESPVEVTSVRAFIRDGRVQAHVEGELGDGCTSLGSITQHRADNTVSITITRVREGDPCTMILKLLREWIPLEGAFEPGDYTVRANDVAVEFSLVEGPGGRLRIEPDPGPPPE